MVVMEDISRLMSFIFDYRLKWYLEKSSKLAKWAKWCVFWRCTNFENREWEKERKTASEVYIGEMVRAWRCQKFDFAQTSSNRPETNSNRVVIHRKLVLNRYIVNSRVRACRQKSTRITHLILISSLSSPPPYAQERRHFPSSWSNLVHHHLDFVEVQYKDSSFFHR